MATTSRSPRRAPSRRRGRHAAQSPAGTRRTRPRRRRRGPIIRLVSTLATMAGLMAAAGLLVVLRSGGSSDATMAGTANRSPQLREVARPDTGRAVTVTMPGGDRLTIAAVRAATSRAPLSGLAPPPAGRRYAFIDYVLTNPHSRPVRLEFPANLFLRRSVVPPDFADRCIYRAGAPAALCDVPGRTRVIAQVNGSAGLLRQDSATFLAPRASYLVRVMSDAPVPGTVTGRDMGLYLVEARYTRDGIARRIPSPR